MNTSGFLHLSCQHWQTRENKLGNRMNRDPEMRLNPVQHLNIKCCWFRASECHQFEITKHQPFVVVRSPTRRLAKKNTFKIPNDFFFGRLSNEKHLHEIRHFFRHLSTRFFTLNYVSHFYYWRRNDI